MRRLMQASGAEVIHLGHNRSVAEIVHCAVQEDVQGIAITSYQGGHVEYLKYMIDLPREPKVAGRSAVFGGGGGTILPAEIDDLQAYGVARIYSPDDGRAMGLVGMINDLLARCDFEKRGSDFAPLLARLAPHEHASIAALITIAENFPEAGDRPSTRPRGAGGDPAEGAGARDHGDRWGREVEPRRRARPALPRRQQGHDDRGPLGRPVEAEVRRRAPGRSDPDERHQRPTRVHAVAGHAAVEPRAVQAREGVDRSLPRGGVRPHRGRDVRDRASRTRRSPSTPTSPST